MSSTLNFGPGLVASVIDLATAYIPDFNNDTDRSEVQRLADLYQSFMHSYFKKISEKVTTNLSEGAAGNTDGDKDEIDNDDTTENTTNPDYAGDDPGQPDDEIPF